MFTMRNAMVALACAFAMHTAIAGGKADQHDHERPSASSGHRHNVMADGAQKPHVRRALPPTEEESHYELLNVAPTLQHGKQQKVLREGVQQFAATAECKDINGYLSRSGAALADYIAGLPDHTCTYGLFSASASQAQQIYSSSNMIAIANKLATLSASYNATGYSVNNLVLVLRAGYYQAYGGAFPVPGSDVNNAVYAALDTLFANPSYFLNNSTSSTTSYEAMILITNMNAELRFLPVVKSVVQRFTNTAGNPNAANGLLNNGGSGAMTGALTVFFRSHYRTDPANTLRTDTSLPQALYSFVQNNRAALMGGSYEFQLNDALNESFRFMQYAEQKPAIKPNVKAVLAANNMIGSGQTMWLAAAQAVEYYDWANCSEYGVCNYKQDLANAVLSINHSCSSTIRIRAQEMTAAQLSDSCAKLVAGEEYFHAMMQTGKTPVADDNNAALEVVVFDDYTNYDKYAGVLFGIGTDNGGMYLEGNPAEAGNQARFIAHEASWLRPSFQIWNLEHEYVHYLDGRFNLYGNFTTGTSKPTVWWLEGLGEYLSLKNNNQASIDVAKQGTYKLSEIFGNTYSMNDYVTRAYRWGYMAVRFMNEKHRADIDAILPKFRSGDYNGYWAYMQNIGTRYDAEFAAWVQTATTAGEPPVPAPVAASTPLSNKVVVKSSAVLNAENRYHIDVPAGMSKLEIKISGGRGDADLYVRLGAQPTLTQYDYRPYIGGNNETVTINNPAAGRYHVMLRAYKAFSDVSLVATISAPPVAEQPSGPACAAATQLTNGCVVRDLAASGDNKYLTMWVPANARNLVIRTSGGTGNADLYVGAGFWAMPNGSYTLKSANAGNTEQVTQATPSGGWYYITLSATAPFSGVGITASYDVQ